MRLAFVASLLAVSALIPAAIAAKAPAAAAQAKAATTRAPGADQMMAHGRFTDIAMYAPKRQVKSFVLLLSGQDGWQARDAETARRLAERGALVAGIDTAKLYADFETATDKCLFADGDFENLSRYLQAYYKLPGYFPPILVGEGSGATLAYMLDAQAAEGTFGGAISLGFCPQTRLRKPFCKGENLRYARSGVLKPARELGAPWIWIDAQPHTDPARCGVAIDPDFPDIDAARRIVSAASNRERLLEQSYDALADKLAALQAASPPALLSDLPLVEVPDAGGGELFAVLISGDGGWAGIDKDVASALQAQDVAVVGLDSLRYFWTERTPAGVARDLDRIVQYYSAHWQKSRVVLIGYSQGANVLPFALNRLSAATRERVAASVMMGLGERADFEFHLSNWVRSSDDGLPIAPELQRLVGGNPVCIYGEQETDSLCPTLDPARIRLIRLPGGHHFDGDYERLARLIIDTARRPLAAR